MSSRTHRFFFNSITTTCGSPLLSTMYCTPLMGSSLVRQANSSLSLSFGGETLRRLEGSRSQRPPKCTTPPQKNHL
jgi:hypothetical protein